MGLELSKDAQDFISNCRSVAERYKTDFIGTSHFCLVYNKYRSKSDEKISISDLKSHISYLKISSSPNFDISKNIALTIKFENALKFANLLTWILDEECIDIYHLFSFLKTEDIKTAKKYILYVESKQIKMTPTQKFVVKMYFNPLGSLLVKLLVLRER